MLISDLVKEEGKGVIVNWEKFNNNFGSDKVINYLLIRQILSRCPEGNYCVMYKEDRVMNPYYNGINDHVFFTRKKDAIGFKKSLSINDPRVKISDISIWKIKLV